MSFVFLRALLCGHGDEAKCQARTLKHRQQDELIHRSQLNNAVSFQQAQLDMKFLKIFLPFRATAKLLQDLSRNPTANSPGLATLTQVMILR